MTPVYAELDWAGSARAFAAVDRFLTRALDRPAPGRVGAFRTRFEQANHLEVPQTGFTPLMLYALYSIAAATAPRRVVGCGTYVGLAFAMLAAGAVDRDPGARADAAEDDPDAAATARRNASRMGLQDAVHYQTGSSVELVRAAAGPIDVLFLDVDDPVRGKEDYPLLAELAHPKLSPGGVIVAHDAVVARCRRDVANLRTFLNRTGQYRGPWVLPVDTAGALIGVKR